MEKLVIVPIHGQDIFVRSASLWSAMGRNQQYCQHKEGSFESWCLVHLTQSLLELPWFLSSTSPPALATSWHKSTPKCSDSLYIFGRSLNHPSFFKNSSQILAWNHWWLYEEAEMIFNHFYCSESNYWANTMSRTALCTWWYEFSFGASHRKNCVYFCYLRLFFSVWFLQ